MGVSGCLTVGIIGDGPAPHGYVSGPGLVQPKMSKGGWEGTRGLAWVATTRRGGGGAQPPRNARGSAGGGVTAPAGSR